MRELQQMQRSIVAKAFDTVATSPGRVSPPRHSRASASPSPVSSGAGLSPRKLASPVSLASSTTDQPRRMSPARFARAMSPEKYTTYRQSPPPPSTRAQAAPVPAAKSTAVAGTRGRKPAAAPVLALGEPTIGDLVTPEGHLTGSILVQDMTHAQRKALYHELQTKHSTGFAAPPPKAPAAAKAAVRSAKPQPSQPKPTASRATRPATAVAPAARKPQPAVTRPAPGKAQYAPSPRIVHGTRLFDEEESTGALHKHVSVEELTRPLAATLAKPTAPAAPVPQQSQPQQPTIAAARSTSRAGKPGKSPAPGDAEDSHQPVAGLFRSNRPTVVWEGGDDAMDETAVVAKPEPKRTYVSKAAVARRLSEDEPADATGTAAAATTAVAQPEAAAEAQAATAAPAPVVLTESEEELAQYVFKGEMLSKHIKDGAGKPHPRFFRMVSTGVIEWAESANDPPKKFRRGIDHHMLCQGDSNVVLQELFWRLWQDHRQAL